MRRIRPISSKIKRAERIIGISDTPELQRIAQSAIGDQIEPITLGNGLLD